MDLEYLLAASRCEPNCATQAIPAVAWVGIAVWSLLFLGPTVFAVIRNRRPKFKGPALTGTARILWMTLTGPGGYAPGKLGMALGESYMCRTGLRVDVPGVEPYDVSIRGPVPKRLYLDLEGGGRTVVVQVDSADPKKVRIDFDQPIT
jgi:hypothetical protein